MEKHAQLYTVPTAQNPLRRINTADLMQASNELIIVHNNQDYRLRITRNGKLILTK